MDKSFIQAKIQSSIHLKTKLMTDDALMEKVSELSAVLVDCFKNGNKVYWCGNGGSAADAQHLSAELSGRYYFDRPPLNSEALHVNTSYITAVANDYSFDEIYARAIQAFGSKGDVLIGMSTSGNSGNVLRALERARELGITTVAFTGETGGKMMDAADFLINIPSTDTPRIQECHMLIGHTLCEIIEKGVFG
ncbi:D-sedoheptulose 7-phosphate isomerase [Crocinitomicaceae bacterium]|jgi:D-sedoheptulose 7-phosphate isomerase|nr:D-sedoheptulose 7-phosphate isomerase [Crocinitomicaceae bacterium]MDG1347959.1 D-sedoheptulose 7-phosphate isomerase [Crocinitomicaceae bacterium]MDG2465580.1 D-sedoheptulose 7-phosphate isomerase [Crocinitomicaceae bacterium]